jgi:hypothetical protein
MSRKEGHVQTIKSFGGATDVGGGVMEKHANYAKASSL